MKVIYTQFSVLILFDLISYILCDIMSPHSVEESKFHDDQMGATENLTLFNTLN